VTAPQTAAAVLLIRPASFGYNEATAASNVMQKKPAASAAQINLNALEEFEGLVRGLRSEGLVVCVVDDLAEPPRPDAIFPNNWVSFHADGTVVLYPMLAENRRLERRAAVIAAVCEQCGFREQRRIDMTPAETGGRFLEGTGSLVLDHAHRVAFACRSPRTDESLVMEWAAAMGFDPVIFDASDARGVPYYHTNVMMWIGTRCAGVCLESIADQDRARVSERLRHSGRELIALSRAAVGHFAGNMLELASWDEAMGDCSVLVMSSAARAALDGAVLRQISGCVDATLAVPLATIETVGGGGVRCMLAEVPLSRGAASGS
jgi:hypothetical protein